MLPFTLLVVALLGLLVAAIDTWVTRSIDNALVARQKADDDLALANIRNELIFALGTRPMSIRGLEVGGGLRTPDIGDDSIPISEILSDAYIALDHRPYHTAGAPGYVVRVQDGRGLLNLNSATPLVLGRFFSLFGIPANRSDHLADTLADWIDDDDLTRLSGAEAQDYARRNRLAPANALLSTPSEAQNVIGWDEIPEVWREDQKTPLFTSCRVSGFNPNTAPTPVLLAYSPGLRPDLADAFMADRAQGADHTAVSSMTFLGLDTSQDGVIAAPGNCLVVDVTAEASGEQTRLALSLLPFSEDRPWQIDYVFKLPKPDADQTDLPASLPVFPTPEMLAGLRRPGKLGDATP